jgi:hypothetical protein
VRVAVIAADRGVEAEGLVSSRGRAILLGGRASLSLPSDGGVGPRGSLVFIGDVCVRGMLGGRGLVSSVVGVGEGWGLTAGR